MKNPLKKAVEALTPEKEKKAVKNDAPRDFPKPQPDVPEKKQREFR